MLPSQYLDAYQRVIGFGLVLEILGLSSILIYMYIVTMAMDGRLKASVVIWSVEAHESQEVDHVMRRGPNIGISSFSIVYYYTSTDRLSASCTVISVNRVTTISDWMDFALLEMDYVTSGLSRSHARSLNHNRQPSATSTTLFPTSLHVQPNVLLPF